METTESKEKKIKLRGKRPPGVIGEMKSEELLEVLRRMREESDPEEEKRTWKKMDRILREEPIRV